MTRLEALVSLRDAVECGGFWNGMMRPPELMTDLCWRAFEGSLDAAIVLFNVVLPGWSWIKPGGHEMGCIRIFGPDNGDYYPSAIGKSENPARALLMATLNALIAREQDQ